MISLQGLFTWRCFLLGGKAVNPMIASVTTCSAIFSALEACISDCIFLSCFILSLNKYLLSTDFVSGTVLGIGNAVVIQTKTSALVELPCLRAIQHEFGLCQGRMFRMPYLLRDILGRLELPSASLGSHFALPPRFQWCALKNEQNMQEYVRRP